MKNRRKVHMVIFIVIIAAMMINTGAIPGSSYKEKANQGRLFGPFLFIEPEKTEIFETEPLNVTVSINDVFVNDFRPLFAKFYIYIIYEPSNPQNLIVDELYRRVIGHSKLLSYSDLEREVTVKNCSFTTLQSFEKGYIRAKVVPLWLSKMPRLLGFYLNFCNCPRRCSNTENITVYNILDEMGNIGVQKYSFTHIFDEDKGKWKEWQYKEKQNKNSFPPWKNEQKEKESESSSNKTLHTYEIKANSQFKMTVYVYNKLNIDIDPAWIQVSLIKPSAFGVGIGEDTIAIASQGFKINKSVTGGKNITEVNLTGYIPLNIGEGQYRTKATVYLPYTGWIPTPNSDYGDYLYVYGGMESSLISNSQLEDIENTLFMLIPVLFVLGLVFAASKRYIYHKMDEKLEKEVGLGKPKT